MTIADTLRHLGLSAPDPRSDGELLSRFVAVREEAAFVELLRRHGPTVYGVCRRVLGNAPDADDAFQAAFLVLARKANTVRPPGMVGNWLYGVAVRTAHKARVMNAKRSRREGTPHPPGAAPQTAPGGCGVPSDTLAVIDGELAALPAVYRAAFVACDLNGRTRSEAARDLGWPEGTVAARLAKARELLAARLSKRGITLGAGLFAAMTVPATTAAEAMSAVRELLAVGTASAVSPAAQTLSDEVVKSMQTIQLKWMLLAGLVLTLATGGAVLLAAPGDHPTRQHIKAPVPKEQPMEWKEGKPIKLDTNSPITGVAFSPDGKLIAVGQNAKTTLYDPAEAKAVWTHDESGPAARVAFSPDGAMVATTFQDGVKLLDTNTGMVTITLEEKGLAPTALAFTPYTSVIPNGSNQPVRISKVLFGHPGRLITKVWQDGGPPGGINAELAPKGVAPDGVTALPLAAFPDGLRVLTLGPVDEKTGQNVLWAWAAGGRGETKLLEGHKARPVAVAVSADGTRLVSADQKGTLIAWEGEKFKEKRRVELGDGVVQLALAPDGKTVAAVRAYSDTTLFGTSGRTLFNLELFVFDAIDPPEKPKALWSARGLLSDAKTFAGPASLAFSPDGKTLLAAFADPYTDDSKERGAVPKSMGVKVWELVPKK